MKKVVRIDQLLVTKGFVESRSQAQRLVMAGEVRVNGQIVPKPSSKVSENAEIVLTEKQKYVSRGGEKLKAALDSFSIDVSGKVCADVGASTGGFTDCLLQHGARRIYAIDVGHGILHWKLRKDERVIVKEKTNVRYLKQLDEVVDLVTIDASFISLRLILPVVKNWLKANKSDVIALVKPQFEAGRKEAARGKGVIRDENIHRDVLLSVLAFAGDEGYQVNDVMKSPILGPKGNVEFLIWLQYPREIDLGWIGKVDALFEKSGSEENQADKGSSSQ